MGNEKKLKEHAKKKLDYAAYDFSFHSGSRFFLRNNGFENQLNLHSDGIDYIGYLDSFKIRIRNDDIVARNLGKWNSSCKKNKSN